MGYKRFISSLPDGTPGWQPFSTAPKDGSYILAYAPDRYPIGGGTKKIRPYRVVFWSGNRWVVAGSSQVMSGWIFSHWMPIPDPPEAP